METLDDFWTLTPTAPIVLGRRYGDLEQVAPGLPIDVLFPVVELATYLFWFSIYVKVCHMYGSSGHTETTLP